MAENYDPVYLKNESIVDKKHKVGDKITFKVTEVMDDGVRAVCSHSSHGDGRKEMAENVTRRYNEAMNGGTETQTGNGGY